MSEAGGGRSGVPARKPAHRPLATITIFAALAAFALPVLDGRIARAAALTDEARAAFIKSAEESCFEGQSKQAGNKSRKPEQLRALCSCMADKLSYTMTMEKLIATTGKPFAPPAEDERMMRAVFDNCWQVNVK
ncbi:MAG: hypothetical protein E6G97_07055 [Alphaproteobacteria bacterium]|nr:MAG: hypothetical protein E6G97_07055 [Alphaproteobacteria bacterium]